MSNLSDIVNVSIEIENVVSDKTSFDHLLVFGPAPAVSPTTAPADVGMYSSFDEVQNAGWVSSGDSADAVGIAAMVAFSQTPKPQHIYIAVQKQLEALLSGMIAKIITTASVADILPTAPAQAPESLPWLQIQYTKTRNLSALTLSVEKDDVLVYGNTITDRIAGQGLLQIPLGATPMVAGGDVMNIVGSLDGSYEITLEATYYDKKTTLKQVITLDSTIAESGEVTASAAVLEPAVDTVKRALSFTGWYIACPAGVPEAEYEDVAEYIETTYKMFAYPILSNLSVVSDVYYRSFGILAKETMVQSDSAVPEKNLYIHVAWCAAALRYSSGKETWAFKNLAAISASTLTANEMRLLKEANISYFVEYAGKAITQGGKVLAGEWIDVIRFRDWLQNDMQIRILNLLTTNPKIPYTNPGIALVENQMIASLKAGINNGGVAPDEYDVDGNRIPGFTVSVPNAANITSTQKASRVLSDCKFTARIAGAIHVVNISGALAYNL